MSYLITIAIPTYNRANLLDRQLERILLQNPSEKVEILVYDNCSDDHTAGVVNKYQKYNSNLYYYRQSKNLGLDGNVYSCYEKARGKFVWFLSDDDELAENAIEQIKTVVKENPAATVLVFGFEDKNQVHGYQASFMRNHAAFDSEESFEDFFKVIMISTLVLKKVKVELSFFRSLEPTIFPQVTLALCLLREKYLLLASSQVIVYREPGYITNNFFELYCLNPRKAIRNASWPDVEEGLLKFTERSLKEFIRLEILEKIGYYKSRSGLPVKSIIKAFHEFGCRVEPAFFIALIFFISRVPRNLLLIVFLLSKFIKSISLKSVIESYQSLVKHNQDYIVGGKNSDV